MAREAEIFRKRLDALRPGASAAHTVIIDKLSVVVESSHTIVQDTLNLVKHRKPTNDVSR